MSTTSNTTGTVIKRAYRKQPTVLKTLSKDEKKGLISMTKKLVASAKKTFNLSQKAATKEVIKAQKASLKEAAKQAKLDAKESIKQVKIALKLAAEQDKIAD